MSIGTGVVYASETGPYSPKKKRMSKEERAFKNKLKKMVINYQFNSSYESDANSIKIYSTKEMEWLISFCGESLFSVRNYFCDESKISLWQMLTSLETYQGKDIMFPNQIDFVYTLVGVQFDLGCDPHWIVKSPDKKQMGELFLSAYYFNTPKYPEECVLKPEDCRLHDIEYKVTDRQKLQAEHFFKEHAKCGHNYEYIFGAGLSCSLRIRCTGCGKEFNVTEF